MSSPPPATRRRLLVAGLLAAAVAASLTAGSPLRRAVVAVAGAPARWQRAAVRPTLEPFGHLAASQLGFAPDAPKTFTSPRPFTTFAVVDVASGARIWQGGEPSGTRATTVLGPIERVWIGDFTAFVTPGRYKLVIDGGFESFPFTIAHTVYDSAIRAVQRVFYFQRAFTAITAPHAEGPWVHASDAALAPPGVRQGWHDAGDHSVYNATTVASLFWLLEAWADFRPTADDTNIPESGNGVPDLLDEVRWGLEWLLSTANADGAFRNSSCLTEYRAYGSSPPERAAPYVHGEAGTLPTARAVGILAAAAPIFSPFDAPFAARLTEAAHRGWRYLAARPGEHSDGPTCAAYRQDGDVAAGRGARMFAAAGMLLLTGAPEFRDAFENVFDAITHDPSAYRFNAYAGLLYLRATAGAPARQAMIRAHLEALRTAVVAETNVHPFGWAGRYVWGSNGIAFERTGATTVKACVADRHGAADACVQALVNLDYLFGRNVYQFAYVSGVGGLSQARQHTFHHWLASLDAAPFLFPGAVAGGPNARPEPDDGSRPLARPPVWGYWNDPAMPRDDTTPVDGRFTDNDSWSTNELAIGWQAATLYNLYFARWATAAPAGARSR